MNIDTFMNQSGATQVIEILGWVFVHSLWQFSLIAVLTLVVLRVLWLSSSQVRSAFLHVMLLLALASPVATGIVLTYQPTHVPAQSEVALERADSTELSSKDSTGAPQLQGPPAASVPDTESVSSLTQSSEPTATVAADRQQPLGNSSPAGGDSALTPWLAPVVGFWCIGILICSLRPIMGWRMLRHLKCKGISPVSSEIQAVVERASRRLGMTNIVQVFESTLACVPAVIGYLKPVILIPTSLLTNMPIRQLEAILAHELAHVRRHDFLINVLQVLFETLFFYHPAVWWLSRRIRVEREHCCDDLVVRVLDNRMEYARALIAIEDLRGRSSVLALGGSDGSLVERIRRLTGQPDRRSRISALTGMFVLMSLAGVILSFTLMSNYQAVAGDQPVVSDEILPDGATLRFGSSQYRLGIPVSNLAISRNEAIAVAVNDRDARVFDFATGEPLYSLGGGIEAAAISPDGRTIVTKQDFSLRIRNAADGDQQRIIALPRSNRYSENGWVKFTPSGEAIAVTSQGKVVHLYDSENGELIREFSNDNPESSLSEGFSSVLDIAFSHDGRLMATGGFANDQGTYFARLWNVETGEELRRFMHTTRSYGIPSLAFSPDGSMLATRSHDGIGRVFDVETGELLHAFPKDGGGRRLGGVAFSPNGERVAVAGDSIRFYDVESGEERLHIDAHQACNLQFTDGGMTLSGAVLGSLCRWDTTSGNLLTPAGSFSVVDQVLVTPDDSRVITRGGYYGDVHIWDGKNGDHLEQLFPGARLDLAMTFDGRYLVWPATDDRIEIPDPIVANMNHYGARLRMYDLQKSAFVDRFPGYEGSAADFVLTSETHPLMTVGQRDGFVRIWDLDSAEVARQFRVVPDEEQNQVRQVSRAMLSPDGRTLAVAYFAMEEIHLDEDGRRIDRLGRLMGTPRPIRLWDVETGECLQEFANTNNKMAFSPDGQFFACTSGIVRSVTSGETIANLRGEQSIQSITFSPDGQFVATAVGGKSIQVWETSTWTKQHEFTGHEQLRTLVFSHEGRLFSGSGDTTVMAWALP